MKTAEENRLEKFTGVLTRKLKRVPTTDELRAILDEYVDYLEKYAGAYRDEFIKDYIIDVSTQSSLEKLKKQFHNYVQDNHADSLSDAEVERWIVDYIAYLEEGNHPIQPDDNWTEFMNEKIKEELE